MNKEDIEIYEEEISVDVKSDVLKGDPGADGANGKDGQNGKNGIDGKSAYKIWLEQGNEGTEEDFIASLKGEQGEKPVLGTDYFTEADKQEIIKELTQDIEEAKSNFNSNAVEKTNTFNSNATSKLEEYNLNAENKLNEFNENASSYEERIETLESENVELKAKDIELEAENERLREDLNNIAITGQVSGESITINDSAEARFPELKVSGNSWQETRSGKNLANITKHTNTLDAGTTIIDSNTYQLNLDEENLTTKSWKGSITLKFENLEKNTDYVVSFKYTDGYNTYIKIQGDSVTIIEKYISGYPDGLSFNTGENNVVNVTIYANGSNANATGIITISEIQIEKGAVKTDYEPYGAMPSTEFRSEIRNCGDNINILKLINTNKTINGVEFTVNKDGSITAKGTATEQAIYLINSTEILTFLESMPKGNYVLSGGISSDAYIQIYTDKASSTGQYYFSSKSEPLNINIDIDVSYTAYIVVKSGVTINDTFYPKLEKGTKATQYSQSGQGNINFTIGNKNICTQFIKGIGINSTIGSEITNSNGATTDFIKIDFAKNETYYLSGLLNTLTSFVAAYNKDKEFLGRTGVSEKTCLEITENGFTGGTAQATGDIEYIRIYQYKRDSNTGTIDDIDNAKIQLEAGETATEYEEHKEQNFTFPLLEGQRLYKDSYLADDGIHHKRGQVVLTGNENWQDYTTQIEGYYKAFTVDIKTNSKFYSATNPLCNYFIAKNVSYVKEDGSGIYSNQYATYISVPDTVATNVNELKSYLAEQYANGKPVILEYELAEEVVEPYTEEQQKVYNEIKKTAHSYKGTTHIFCTDEISCNFEATYIKDLETYNGIISAKERTWKKIRTITIPSDDYKEQEIDGVTFGYSVSTDGGIKGILFSTDENGDLLEKHYITGVIVRLTPTTNININQGFVSINSGGFSTQSGYALDYITNIKANTTVRWFEYSLQPYFSTSIANNPGTYRYPGQINQEKIKDFCFTGFEATSVLGEGTKLEIWAYGYWD